MSGLKNNVPATMRKPLEQAGVILPVIISQHYGGDLNEAIEFIAGALNHQTRVTAVKEDGKTDAPTFHVVIDKVEVLERRAGNSLLGRKAKVHYHDAKDKGADPENIDTGWIEYNGTDPGEYGAWQTSLANTLVDIAEANIGKECYMTKAYVLGVKTKHSNSGKVKFLANLEPAGGKDAAPANKPSAGASRRSSNELTIDAFEKYVEGIKEASDDQVNKVLDNGKLLKSLVSAINEGGSKAADDVLNVVIDTHGDDAVTRKIEDTFFDEADNNLAKAAARLVAITA
jgi:hypothetical protein